MGDSLRVGGTEGQFVEVARGLDRSRWDPHVSCLLAEGPLRARLLGAGIEPWSCGRGTSLKSPAVLAAICGVVRYLRARRIQLIHSFDFYSNVVGVLAGRLARVPVTIASQRDLGNLRPRLQERVQGVLLRHADYVLVNSPAVADRLRRDPRVSARRIVLIPNGVDVDRFSPVPDDRRRGDGVVTIGTLANLRPEKGLTDLLHAAALVRDQRPRLRVVIWGDGPLRGRLHELLISLRLTDTVELRGRTTEPNVALRELDVFVLPSLSEACSNALLEAMAMELPVVATRVGGNVWVVDDEETGLLVPPGDPPALAKALLRLMDAPDFASELGRAARDRIRGRFATASLHKNVDDFYRRALSTRTT